MRIERRYYCFTWNRECNVELLVARAQPKPERIHALYIWFRSRSTNRLEKKAQTFLKRIYKPLWLIEKNCINETETESLEFLVKQTVRCRYKLTERSRNQMKYKSYIFMVSATLNQRANTIFEFNKRIKQKS